MSISKFIKQIQNETKMNPWQIEMLFALHKGEQYKFDKKKRLGAIQVMNWYKRYLRER